MTTHNVVSYRQVQAVEAVLAHSATTQSLRHLQGSAAARTRSESKLAPVAIG
jgi:hypothetical protein